MKTEPFCQQQKDSQGSVDFSDVQIMHKFVGWVTSNLDFKVIIFFIVKYLKNGTRESCNLQWNTDRSCLRFIIEWCHFQWPWMTCKLTQILRAHSYSVLNISETVQDGSDTRLLVIQVIHGVLNYFMYYKWFHSVYIRNSSCTCVMYDAGYNGSVGRCQMWSVIKLRCTKYKQGLYAAAVSFCLSVYLFVCLSLERVHKITFLNK